LLIADITVLIFDENIQFVRLVKGKDFDKKLRINVLVIFRFVAVVIFDKLATRKVRFQL
jgi:hypothetical protein